MVLHRVAWSLLLLVLAGVASACGGSGEDSPGTTATPSSTAASEVATQAGTAAGTSTAVGTATGTAQAEVAASDGVRAFARTIDEALGRGDLSPIVDRMRGSPDFALSYWRQPRASEPLGQARSDVRRLLTPTGRPDRDSYGLAGPKVAFIGYDAKPYVTVTAIALDEATGYRRLAVLLELRYCDTSCAAADAGRWTIVGAVLDWGGDSFLRRTDEVIAAYGRLGEVYVRPLVLTPEIRNAALSVARDFGDGVRAIPDCVPAAACITTVDAGVAVDLGLMRLGYQAPASEGGGALVFAGRMADGSWRYWFGTQNAHYQLVDLPGDVLVCADGDGLNARERPDPNSPVVGFVTDLTRLRAEEFVLTEPGRTTPALASGAGWYRVSVGSPAKTGWVSSRFVSDAQLKDCAVRDGFERPR